MGLNNYSIITLTMLLSGYSNILNASKRLIIATDIKSYLVSRDYILCGINYTVQYKPDLLALALDRLLVLKNILVCKSQVGPTSTSM